MILFQKGLTYKTGYAVLNVLHDLGSGAKGVVGMDLHMCKPAGIYRKADCSCRASESVWNKFKPSLC